MRHVRPTFVGLLLLFGGLLLTARVALAVGGVIFAIPASVEVGGTTTITGYGFASGPVAIRIMGTPGLLTSAIAGADGAFSADVTLPANLAAEDYTLEAESADGSKAHTDLRVVPALPSAFITVSVPREAAAGEPVSVAAMARDRQGRPLAQTVVRFAATSRFLLDSRAGDLLMDIGSAEVNPEGIAAISFTPGEPGPVQVVAYTGPSWDKRRAEGWTQLDVAPATTPLYAPSAGIAFLPIGPLALGLLLIAVFAFLLVVVRQTWGIGARAPRGHPWVSFSLPAVTLAGVTALGAILVWVVVTGPSTHAHLGDGNLPALSRADVHPVGAPMVATTYLLPETDGVGRGQALFGAYCASCHSATADGGVGPSLKKHAHTTAEAEYLLRRGVVGRIPAFTQAQISDEQMQELLAYMVSIDAAQPVAVAQQLTPTPSPTPVQTPAPSPTPAPPATPTAPAAGPTPTVLAAAPTPTTPPAAVPTATPPPAPTGPPAPPPPPGQPGASFTVKVSARGFNDTPGDLYLPVTAGQTVQITFVYDDYDLAEDNPHNIGIETYGIQVTVSRASPQAVATFRADQVGEFNIACLNDECQGHRNLQRGWLRVTR